MRSFLGIETSCTSSIDGINGERRSCEETYHKYSSKLAKLAFVKIITPSTLDVFVDHLFDSV